MFDLDPQTTDEYWDAYMAAVDADALLISDDELAMLSDDIDTWPEDDNAIVLPFSDGLGFDYAN